MCEGGELTPSIGVSAYSSPGLISGILAYRMLFRQLSATTGSTRWKVCVLRLEISGTIASHRVAARPSDKALSIQWARHAQGRVYKALGSHLIVVI